MALCSALSSSPLSGYAFQSRSHVCVATTAASRPGSGSNYVIWRSDDPLIGTYKISVFFGHPSVGRLADHAPFTVVTASGSTIVHVNLNQEPGEWHALGTFTNPRYVRLTNQADGVVIADAVHFERLHW